MTPFPAPCPAAEVTDRLPVARVAVDIPLAHLDRLFDYAVPAAMAEAAVPGCRVRVRFSGQRVDGYLLERVGHSEHAGPLGRLERIVSPEVVMGPDIARLCRLVADRYAGTFADVARLAVPPRHARTERAPQPPPSQAPLPALDTSPWRSYPGGAGLVERLAAGAGARACWTALGGHDWRQPLAVAVLAALRSGSSAVVCLPDARHVAAFDAVLLRLLGTGRHTVLTADLGPAARYRAFLAAARGRVQAVVGTRAAAFAPVHRVGLFAIWDDGDDSYVEPRAPYPHTREVLSWRVHDQGAALLLAGNSRSVAAQALVDSGWCVDLSATASQRRAESAAVRVAGAPAAVTAPDPAGPGARLPAEILRLLRAGVAHGPVLVSVARTGYRGSLSCQTCRAPARCGVCSGPLDQAAAGAVPSCRWCGREATSWSCTHCGGRRLRAPVVGAVRTAEELGRAFPGVGVRSSHAGSVVDRVSDRPAVVVATPGAEPVADDGYRAAAVLDTALSLSRPDLRSAEEAVRRWSNVAALVRPDGQVVLAGDAAAAPLQAMVRADPVGFASRELELRREARLPPAVRLVAVEGPGADVLALRGEEWPHPVDVLGPVPVDPDTMRLLVRVPVSSGRDLARVLKGVAAHRSLHKLPSLRIRVDPVDIG